ncbi:Longin-like domain-containing protein [Biscogniauxia sp. FL1348]|nr:Longin-like domain-containing protein [Biscogniauxia sp. FL1348]
MAIAIPSIACLGVIGRNNNPLHITIFPSYDSSTHTLAPLRTPLQFSLLLSSTLDIFEFRTRHARAAGTTGAAAASTTTTTGLVTGDFGLLHAVDDRLACYGFETNTGVKFIAVVDMRGRVPGLGDAKRASVASAAASAVAGSPTTASAPALGAGVGGGIGGPGGAATAAAVGAATSGVGLRDTELKVVFRAMQTAYVRLLQNPFYDPEETGSVALALGSRGPAAAAPGGGKRITSRRFAEEMRRIGEGWAPGVVVL